MYQLITLKYTINMNTVTCCRCKFVHDYNSRTDQKCPKCRAVTYQLGDHTFIGKEVYVVMENNGLAYEDNMTYFHKVYSNLEDAQKDVDDFNNKQFVNPTQEEYNSTEQYTTYEEYCIECQQNWEYNEKYATRIIIPTILN